MSKRQQIREKQRRQAIMQRITVVLVMVLVAVGVVGWVVLAQRPVEGVVQVTPVPRPQAKANTAGDPNAPLKLVEYGDFQCPHCARFWRETEAELVETYVATGKVHFEYRSVGLFLGPESAQAAEAAYCAGDQEKFWDMHDTIFANQGLAENAGALNDTRLKTFATNIGLDMSAFNACFDGDKYKQRVEQDRVDADAQIPAASNYAEVVAAGLYDAGGISTPSFLLNGKLLPGALSFAELQAEIAAALAAAGQ
jgi:protein-disulfide isomerase